MFSTQPEVTSRAGQVSPIVTCIVLTMNNTHELKRTLVSIASQHWVADADAPGPAICEVLVIDSSDDLHRTSLLMREVFSRPPSLGGSFVPILIHQYPPRGIYPAMNLGIDKSRGQSIIFMNSGDHFYCRLSLGLLISNRYIYQKAKGVWPRVVFGQARIVPSQRLLPAWFVPDRNVSCLRRWLKFFLPSHQSMLVDRSWAESVSFDLACPQSADVSWMRSALDSPSAYVYLPTPVACFYLGGISSALPDLKTLRIRIAEPSRRTFEKIVELLKFFLSPVRPIYPLLMFLKSRLIGIVF